MHHLRMIPEILTAIFKAGIPIGIAAYLLVWWALRNGYLNETGSVRDLEKEVKKMAKDKESKLKSDPVHKKWLSMGGGFYGVVAVLTWLFVELREILEFITSFDGIAGLIDNFSFDMLIRLFIEAIKNTFLALAWPVYWLSDIPGEYIWAWFIVAYAGYWAGSKLALRQWRIRRADRSPPGPE
jgi:hypothetical protein